MRAYLKVGAGLAFVVLVILTSLYLTPQNERVIAPLPDRLTDAEFWNLVNDFSEPGGYFRSDNFISNETAFQHVIPRLKKQVQPGGVYLGVGPDQNFTYVVSLQPKLAFITDIRRQNMLQHLMYKALLEMSATRADFLSKLFARHLPPGMPETVTTTRLFETLENETADPQLAQETLASIFDRLREYHRFTLGADDCRSIENVYNAFVSGGPDIRYSFPNQNLWRRFPTYSELMLENDGTRENEGGENHSYMASEENFQQLKKLETENRIVPLVGDFAGEKALRSIGHYLKSHGATVTAFYTSNVEFYLFQNDDWKKFFNNVAALPMNSTSVVIRSYFNNYALQFPNPPSWLYPPPPSYTLLDSLPGVVDAFEAGRIQTYTDVIRRSSP